MITKPEVIRYSMPLAFFISSGFLVFKNIYVAYLNLFNQSAWNLYPSDLIEKLNKKYPTIADDIPTYMKTIDDIVNRSGSNGNPHSIYYVRSNGLKDIFFLTDDEKEVLNNISELLCDISNTLLWRHAKVDDRNISVINRKLKEPVRAFYKNLFLDVAKNFDSIFMWENKSFDYKVVTGFVGGESPKTNAAVHNSIKPEAMINCDIAKFFESTTYYNIIQNNLFLDSLISSIFYKQFGQWPIDNLKDVDIHFKNVISLCYELNYLFMFMMPAIMHNGRIPTGAPFSPVICNIVLKKIDIEILSLVRDWTIKYGCKMRYTRYADDITISSAKYKNHDEYILNMEKVKDIESIINKYGYYLKYSKTRINGKRDNKEITGVNITSNKTTISSDKKMELATELSNVIGPLSHTHSGHLSWIRSVNKKQWAFCLSHYYVNNIDIFKKAVKQDPNTSRRFYSFQGFLKNRNLDFDALDKTGKMLFIRYLLSDNNSEFLSYVRSNYTNNGNSITVAQKAPIQNITITMTL